MMHAENFLLVILVNPMYVEIPEQVDLDKHIVDWTTLHDWIDSQAYEDEGIDRRSLILESIL